MHKRFIIASVVVIAAMVLLVFTATKSTAKAVVTVAELEDTTVAQENIRLGAQLTDDAIDYKIEPEFKLSFYVRDIAAEGAAASKRIPVVYFGVMPDTLKAGRHVILEGDYTGEQFVARSLLTQCPSKYEPPKAPTT